MKTTKSKSKNKAKVKVKAEPKTPAIKDAKKDRKAVAAIFDEIYAERRSQTGDWGAHSFDDLNAYDDKNIQFPDTWCLWMDRHKGTWNQYAVPNDYDTTTLKCFRTAMVRVATTAITAILWVDRKLA